MGCGRDAPQRISDAARAAAKTWQPDAAAGVPSTLQYGNRAAGRPKRQTSAVQDKSYAAIVKRFIPCAGNGALTEDGGGDVSMEPCPSPAVQSTPEHKQLRYWRERRSTAVRWGAADDVVECDKQIQLLEQLAQAQRPWGARVQAATAAQRSAEARCTFTKEDLDAARIAVAHFEQEYQQAQKSLEEAEASLAAVRAEGAQGASRPDILSSSAVSDALATLAAAAGAGGAGAGPAMAQMVEHLRLLVFEPGRGGGAAAVPAEGAAGVQAGLGAGEHQGAGGPTAVGLAERPREDDLPTEFVAAPPEASWQDVLRRVPQAPAATGPQASLEQFFQCAGKGGSKGARDNAETPGPY